SYQCTSYHDAPTLRQLFNLRPNPEFEVWMEELGLMRNGRLTAKAGDPSFFLQRRVA
ncbi:MAG: ethanolamine ammonia-lyase subunit EutB, partial [Anaerolineae bacterium]